MVIVVLLGPLLLLSRGSRTHACRIVLGAVELTLTSFLTPLHLGEPTLQAGPWAGEGGSSCACGVGMPLTGGEGTLPLVLVTVCLMEEALQRK